MFGVYRDLARYLRRYRAAYLLGGVCILAGVGLKVWIPVLIGRALEDIRSAGQDPEELRRLVLRASLYIVGTAVGVSVLRTTSRLLILGSCRRFAHDLRNVVFDHLLKLSPDYYVRNPAGQIMSRSINDMRIVQSLAGPVIMYLSENSVLFLGVLVVMMRTEPAIALAVLLPYPAFLFLARRLALRIQEGSRDAQDRLGAISAKVDESLSGYSVVRTLGIQEQERGRFYEECDDYRRLNLGVTKYRALLVSLMMTLTSLGILIVLGLGAPAVGSGRISFELWVPMVLYVQMLAGPTRTLGFVISTLRRGEAALARIRQILDSEPELLDPTKPRQLPEVRGGLSIRDLTVEYAPLEDEAGRARRRVLDGIDLDVPPGTTLGVVGPTGGGKTTLVRALSRQIPIDEGTILLDGLDVTHLRLEDVRAQIGFVPQDAFLFSRTLEENVALGMPGAPVEAIEQALERAAFAEDFSQLPAGMDTVVGERGLSLSGGQRQRLALARVLLLDRRVLILDDTLSAVDTHTADAILGELRRHEEGRTAILVSHRLATVRHADHIVVLDDGRIVERGTHQELIEQDGLYRDLWDRQQRGAGEQDLQEDEVPGGGA